MVLRYVIYDYLNFDTKAYNYYTFILFLPISILLSKFKNTMRQRFFDKCKFCFVNFASVG